MNRTTDTRYTAISVRKIEETFTQISNGKILKSFKLSHTLINHVSYIL